MANLRLTDISLAASTAITPTTLIHVVTTADTSQYSGGSSYAGTLGQIYDGLSGYCVSDLYVSNIHSCSPLYINPLSEGDVYVGSANTVTIDLSNERVGIGTTTPTAKLHVRGTDDLDATINVKIDNSSGVRGFQVTNAGNVLIGDINSGYYSSALVVRPNTALQSAISVGNFAGTRVYFQNTEDEVRMGGIKYDFVNNSASIGSAIAPTSYSLSLKGSGGFMLQATPSSGSGWFELYASSNNPIIYMGDGAGVPQIQLSTGGNSYINASTGNLGIGTTTPSEKLDVSGKTKTINLQVTSGATNGYVLTSDASGNATWQNKDPYLEYRALITQTGTSAPSESILVNTLTGGTWSYTTVGSYYFSKTGAFSASSKVEVYMNNTIVLSYTMSNAAFNIYSINRLDDDNIEVRTSTWTTDATTGTLLVAPPGATVNDAMSNDLLYNSLVSIRVWL